MKNNRRISLVNCNFNFQNKNSPNTNEIKANSYNFENSVRLQEILQTRKKSQKVKVINNSLEEGIQTTKQASGITLIALVVTIVVLLILAGVSISTVLGNNGIIPRANEAKFKTDLANIQEEFKLYVMDKTGENGDFSVGTLNASADLLTYNTQPDEEKGTGNISSVLKSATAQKYIQNKNFSIIKGDLIYASQNAKELQWAQEVGLAVNPYNIDENGVLLSSETNLMLLDDTTGTLVLPEMVTSIGEGAFGLVAGVRRLIIPSTVREIQKNAFRGCTSLEEVIFETKTDSADVKGTEVIGAEAFKICTSLKSINLPDTVKEIGGSAFQGCTSLTEIILPNNITIIRSAMFMSDYNLKKVTIPENVTKIEWGAFSYCTQLESIRIPRYLVEIQIGCFDACASIANIEVDSQNNNFVLSDNILYNKNKTRMIYILENALGSEQTFNIPETVTQIDYGLINHFTNLNKIKIPASVRQIDVRFFNENITEIEIDENNDYFTSDSVGLYSKNKEYVYMYYKNLKDMQIDDNVKNIVAGAFQRCTNLKSLRIGKNVVELNFNDYRWKYTGDKLTTLEIDEENPKYKIEGQGIYTKDSNGNLDTLVGVWGNVTQFDVPEGVKRLGYLALNRATLTRVTLPNSLEVIDSSVFVDSKITEIRIPNSVKSIGTDVFGGCYSLTKIEIDNTKGSIPGATWGCPIGERGIVWLR